MSSSLRVRIVSAAVLAPVAIAATIAGPPWFVVLVGLFAAAMGWEWVRLTTGGRNDSALAGVAIAVMAGTAIATAMLGVAAGLMIALPGAVLVGLAVRQRKRGGLLAGVGAAYLGAAVVSVVSLRGPAAASAWAVIWLFAVVWTVDIAAYFVGKSVGGPRLAPTISPGKTWSGFAGGTLFGTAVGWAMAGWVAGHAPASAAFLALVLAVIAQIGDLAESAAKRYFGVKDTSSLIPGHGGALDRLDGLMAAALALAMWRCWVGEDVIGWL